MCLKTKIYYLKKFIKIHMDKKYIKIHKILFKNTNQTAHSDYHPYASCI